MPKNVSFNGKSNERKNGNRKWMANIKKDPVKHKKYKEKT